MSLEQENLIIQAMAVYPERYVIGRLKNAISYLNHEQCVRLAIEYVRHLEWLAKEMTYPQLIKLTLDTLKQYQQGSKSIEEMILTRQRVMSRTYYRDGYQRLLRSTLGFTTYLAITLCCQHEIADSGYVFEEAPVTLMDVATYASRTVAIYQVGEDWDSPDKTIRRNARATGKAYANTETRWQIERLLVLVGNG